MACLTFNFSARGLSYVNKGQLQVDPGVIIMGYKGDPVFDNRDAPQRPPWTKDGSMMVFRKLEQDVPAFDKYLQKWGPQWRSFTPVPDEVKPPLTDKEGAEFFGARMMGRWKSVRCHPLFPTAIVELTSKPGNPNFFGTFSR